MNFDIKEPLLTLSIGVIGGVVCGVSIIWCQHVTTTHDIRQCCCCCKCHDMQSMRKLNAPEETDEDIKIEPSTENSPSASTNTPSVATPSFSDVISTPLNSLPYSFEDSAPATPSK